MYLCINYYCYNCSNIIGLIDVALVDLSIQCERSQTATEGWMIACIASRRTSVVAFANQLFLNHCIDHILLYFIV